MTHINDGGPAYPHNEKNGNGEHFYTHRGLTKREYFAMAAMQSIITKATFVDTHGENGKQISKDDMEQFRLDIAVSAIEYADALIAALAQKGE